MRTTRITTAAESAFWTAWLRDDELMPLLVSVVHDALATLETGETITTSELVRRALPTLSQRGIKFVLNGLYLARRDGHLTGWWITDSRRSAWSYGKPSIKWVNANSEGAAGLMAMLA